MCLKKEIHLSTHASNVLLKINQCLSALLSFHIYTRSNYLSKLLKLAKINSETKNEDSKNTILFSFVYITLILSKAEFADKVNRAIIIFFLTCKVLCMAHYRHIKCVCPKYLTV